MRSIPIQRSTLLLDKGARSFRSESRRRSTNGYKSSSVGTCPSCRCTRVNVVQGTKKGISGVVPNGNTRTGSWNALAWYLGELMSRGPRPAFPELATD